MTKRFFVPLWKIEKIEKELALIESGGFRLNRISGLCRYDFVPCSPKKASYFITVNLAKENLMSGAEYFIMQKNGNKINGSLYFGLCSTEIYRFTDGRDPEQYGETRKASVYGVLKTRLWLNAFVIAVILLFVMLDFIIEGFPDGAFSRIEFVALMLFVLASVLFFAYNTVGMIFLKRTGR